MKKTFIIVSLCVVLVSILVSCNNRQSRPSDIEYKADTDTMESLELSIVTSDENICRASSNDSLVAVSIIGKETDKTIADKEPEHNAPTTRELKELMDCISSKLPHLDKSNALSQNIYNISLGEKSIVIGLSINTPYWQDEFKKYLSDSPYIKFSGSATPTPVKSRVDSVITVPGINLTADRSFYSTDSEVAKFTLHNETDQEVVFGEFYIVGYQGEDGIWYVLPNKGVWNDILLGVDPYGSYSMTAYLHPQLNKNKPGTYRFYKEIRRAGISDKVWIMTEFQLHDVFSPH